MSPMLGLETEKLSLESVRTQWCDPTGVDCGKVLQVVARVSLTLNLSISCILALGSPNEVSLAVVQY